MQRRERKRSRDVKVVVADIFPTGYHACELADVSPGETVAVYGGGPVGLMAACSALIRGASRVFVVDRIPERLSEAREICAIARSSTSAWTATRRSFCIL